MDLWSEIKQLEGKVLQTLLQRNKFEVVEVRAATVIIKIVESGSEIRIPWKYFEQSYHELTSQGQISRTGIMERHAPWFPAHVAAILANLPGVTYTVDPIIVLHYKSEK